MLAAHIAALVDRDALAAMECLDRARRDANFDLGAAASSMAACCGPWVASPQGLLAMTAQ